MSIDLVIVVLVFLVAIGAYLWKRKQVNLLMREGYGDAEMDDILAASRAGLLDADPVETVQSLYHPANSSYQDITFGPTGPQLWF